MITMDGIRETTLITSPQAAMGPSVSGMIGATGDNGIGGVGVNLGCRDHANRHGQWPVGIECHLGL